MGMSGWKESLQNVKKKKKNYPPPPETCTNDLEAHFQFSGPPAPMC